jgi:hypothetical protein
MAMTNNYSTNLTQHLFDLLYTQLHVSAISSHPQAVYNYIGREIYNYICNIIKIVLEG